MRKRFPMAPFVGEAKAILAIAGSTRRMKGQGSLEYIMMLAAASLVIVLALAMMVKLRGAVVTSVPVNGVNTSVSNAISGELSSLTANSVV